MVPKIFYIIYIMKQVYKITYPTGKIYIGKDSVGSARYMGSPDMALINADFRKLPKEKQLDYTVRKEILWESEMATEHELSMKEIEFIRKYQSNNPAVGYNQWPKHLLTGKKARTFPTPKGLLR